MNHDNKILRDDLSQTYIDAWPFYVFFFFIPHEYQHTYVEENRFVLSLALGDRSISLALIHHAVRVGFRELAIDKLGKYHILIGKFIRCVPEREINQI